MKKLSMLYVSFLAMLGLLIPLLIPVAASAKVDVTAQAQCQEVKDQTQCLAKCPDPAAPDFDPSKVDASCPGAGSQDKPSDIIAAYVNPFIRFLGIVVGLAVTIGIVWGGIEYASSGGDPSKIARGKKHIIVAIISLLAYFFIYEGITFLSPVKIG